MTLLARGGGIVTERHVCAAVSSHRKRDASSQSHFAAFRRRLEGKRAISKSSSDIKLDASSAAMARLLRCLPLSSFGGGANDIKPDRPLIFIISCRRHLPVLRRRQCCFFANFRRQCRRNYTGRHQSPVSHSVTMVMKLFDGKPLCRMSCALKISRILTP